jgi:hypothetical protein
MRDRSLAHMGEAFVFSADFSCSAEALTVIAISSYIIWLTNRL